MYISGPSAPPSKISRAFWKAGWKRWLKPTLATTPAARAAMTSGSQLGGGAGRRLLHQHMLALLHGCQSDRGQRVVGRRHDHQIDILSLDDGAPLDAGNAAGVLGGELLGAGQVGVGGGDQAAVAEHPRPLVPDQAAADDCYTEGHSVP